MKRFKVSYLLTFMTTAVILSIIGSLAGTLAWYAYFTRATISFSGTSAYASERVRVGIHDESGYLFDNDEFNINSFATSHDLEIDEDRQIIWAREGEGLTGDIISTYLYHSPYAVSELPPVTSLSRNSNSDLTLYKAPFALDPTNRLAGTNYYTKIPLCFKVLDADGDTVGDHDIWLTNISAIDTSIEGLKYALRIFYENKYNETHYLLNPTSESTKVGETVVAGTLDLKGDGTYDYDFISKKEIVYGDYTGTVTYSDDPYEIPSENYHLDDVNNTGLVVTNDNNASTFLAKHDEGVYVADLSSVTLNTAKWETLETIRPTINTSGYYSGGKPVAHTDANKGNIAFTDLTIYLEGWDHAIINRVINASFNLGLQFEVNRL